MLRYVFSNKKFAVKFLKLSDSYSDQGQIRLCGYMRALKVVLFMVLLFLHTADEEFDQCVAVIDTASAEGLPMLKSILSAGDSRRGVAIFGRRLSARVSKLLTSITRRNDTTLFVSSNGVECGGRNLLNIGDLTTAFARFRIEAVHIVFERADFQSRHLETRSHDIGVLLRRYIATLEAIVKHDVTTRVIFHVDVTMSPRHNMTFLCRDPFNTTRDFADVILSTAYSFANVYRNLYKLKHIYNILYVHDI